MREGTATTRTQEEIDSELDLLMSGEIARYHKLDPRRC